MKENSSKELAEMTEDKYIQAKVDQIIVKRMKLKIINKFLLLKDEVQITLIKQL